ncbi:aryl-alcohol dehydrogenase-like predicted oxidoreductase [Paenibacillus phyllosphaerae]|uniref:Aryl-alcohol dehydrogenase-like predicted oxidoreductase n=1 Tax=Paenibacillus phyllosphaerae TaxID=274593 RepID=A0A7W5ATE7_9BACL|nr:aldo/keto reductase [Paenibacillus phyllosphaerae]MBB3108423.1 aryl-alcohol dehydrogenase-like predicted oxidoreductase [Paenibacillus phyllosphaerae]
MKYRKLGKNGPDVSVIGFGTWAIGGGGWASAWGEQDDALSIESVRVALDAGVTFYDTAAVYGLGHSEEVLGRAIGSDRHKVILATKCGLVWDERNTIARSGAYESILREAEASLKRLGTDYIDLYQMHWPAEDASQEETMRAMDKLVQDGKIRHVGMSNYTVEQLERSLTVRHVDSLQPPYSILRPAVEQQVLPFCQQHGIGVVAYSPLTSGLLSGNYTYDTKFSEDDWRSRNKAHTGEGLRQNVDKAERLKAIAARFDLTLPQLAVAYVLAHPALTSALVGVRKPSHITGILPAADVTLDEATLVEIRGIAAE